MSPGASIANNPKRSDVFSFAVVSGHLMFALLPLFVAAGFGFGWHFIPCTIWFGLGMNSILNLMHETSHYHVFKPKWASDVLGRWILGPLSLADFDSFRKRHWQHHRRFGTQEDPKYTYHIDIRGRHFLLFTLRCLLLIEALRKFSVQIPGEDDVSRARSSGGAWLFRTFIVHCALLAGLASTVVLTQAVEVVEAMKIAALVYGLVYLYGLASVTVWAATLRAIAEHQIVGDGAEENGTGALRNFRCGPIGRWLMGMYGFSDHATHHAAPALPYYALKNMTDELAKQDPNLTPAYTYGGTLLKSIRPDG